MSLVKSLYGSYVYVKVSSNQSQTCYTIPTLPDFYYLAEKTLTYRSIVPGVFCQSALRRQN